MSILSRLWNALRPDHLDDELREELETHLAMAAEEERARGLGAPEARALARKRFGSLSMYRGLTREVDLAAWLDDFHRDLLVGWRGLAGNAAITATALIALALGIGANTAIFSVVNASLLQPLPFGDADRLVAVWQSDGPEDQRRRFSARELLIWQQGLGVFEEIGGSIGNGFTLSGLGEPEALRGQLATPGLFGVLGKRPALGRTFLASEGEPGHDHVVLLSDAWWRRRFAADPAILGRSLTLSGEDYTVIGVMPADFDYPGSRYLFWVPAALEGKFFVEHRNAHMFQVVGRVRAGISAARLRSDLAALGRRLGDDGQPEKLAAMPLREALVGPVRGPLLLLLCAGGVVLLIACADLANLLLARATGRRREMAVRAALGASRLALVRQLGAESALLSGLGGAAGFLLAAGALALCKRLGPEDLPWLAKAHLDAWALLFTATVAAVTGLIFGLAPALTALRTRLNEVLQQSARALTGGRGGRALRDALVWGETALCVVLLVGAGLLLRSILALASVDPGFRAENLITASCAMRPSAYPTSAAMLRFYRGALESIASQPGIAAAGTTTALPFTGQDWGNSFEIRERPAPPHEAYNTQFRAVSPGYFRAMGIPLLAGRDLTPLDDARAPGIALVNQAFAHRYWADGRALGNHLRIAGNWLVIAGVVGDVHHLQLDIAPTPEVYLAYPQMDAGLLDVVGRGLYFAVRTTLPTAAAGRQLRAAIHAVDHDMPIDDVRPMHALLDGSFAEARFRTLLIALFAGLAVTLAGVGIYGVVSCTVAQRAHEIGIQMALGATRGRVLTRVLTDTLQLVAPAAAAGLAAAWASSRFLATFLFGISTTDLATYAFCPLAFIAIALAAAYGPALRAASVDPVTTLRQG